MGRLKILEEVAENPKLATVFLLKTLFLLTLKMRELLTEEKQLNKEQVRIINQINHRVLPIAQGFVIGSDEMGNSLEDILQMFEKLDLMDLVLQSLEESQKLLTR